MKIEATKEKLVTAVEHASRVAGRNLSLPVLNTVLLEASGKGLLLVRATNLELGIEIKVPVKVASEGVVAVPGEVLAAVLQNVYESNTITLSVEKDNLEIKTTHGTSTVKAVPHDDFPTIPKIGEGDSAAITFKTTDFIKGVKSVAFSASTSTVKPELASVYIYGENNEVRFVATDSFRLAEQRIAVKKLGDFSPLLIPIRNIIELQRILERSESDELTIFISEQQMAIETDGVYVTSRLLEGNFPDYQQIIPKETNTEAVVLKQDLAHVLKKTGIFSDSFNQLQCDIAPSKKRFTLTTQNKDVGETTETLQASLTGEDLSISFNLRYLTDTLASLTTDSIALKFAGVGKPLVITPVGSDTYLYLVMPMNR